MTQLCHLFVILVTFDKIQSILVTYNYLTTSKPRVNQKPLKNHVIPENIFENDQSATDENKEENSGEYFISSHEQPREVPVYANYTIPGQWAKSAPGKNISLGFIPAKSYSQVRATHTIKRVPREEALEAAETKKDEDTRRLREVISNKKIATIYTEEGYEDSAYDHGGRIRNGDFHQGYAKKLSNEVERKNWGEQPVSGRGKKHEFTQLKSEFFDRSEPKKNFKRRKSNEAERILRGGTNQPEIRDEEGIEKLEAIEMKDFNVKAKQEFENDGSETLNQPRYHDQLANKNYTVNRSRSSKGRKINSYHDNCIIPDELKDENPIRRVNKRTKLKMRNEQVESEMKTTFENNRFPIMSESGKTASSRENYPIITVESTNIPINYSTVTDIIPESTNIADLFWRYFKERQDKGTELSKVRNDHKEGINIDIDLTPRRSPLFEKITESELTLNISNKLNRRAKKRDKATNDIIVDFTAEPLQFNDNHDNSKNILTTLTGKLDGKSVKEEKLDSISSLKPRIDFQEQKSTSYNYNNPFLDDYLRSTNMKIPRYKILFRKQDEISNSGGSEDRNFDYKKVNNLQLNDKNNSQSNYPNKSQPDNKKIKIQHSKSALNNKNLSSRVLQGKKVSYGNFNPDIHLSVPINRQENNMSKLSAVQTKNRLINAHLPFPGKTPINHHLAKLLHMRKLVPLGINNQHLIRRRRNTSDLKSKLSRKRETDLVGPEVKLLHLTPRIIDKTLTDEIRMKFYNTGENKENLTESKDKNSDVFIREYQINKVNSDSISKEILDIDKYPFYDETNSSFQTLKYALNPNLIPKKTIGGMQFYESRNHLQCEEVDPNLDNVPPNADQPEEYHDLKKELPRLNNLGKKLDCFKAKYFDNNPLDNPLFLESRIKDPTLPPELNTTVLASRMLKLSRYDNDYSPPKLSKKPKFANFKNGNRLEKDEPYYKREQNIIENLPRRLKNTIKMKELDKTRLPMRIGRIKSEKQVKTFVDESPSEINNNYGKRIKSKKRVHLSIPYERGIYEDVMDHIQRGRNLNRGLRLKLSLIPSLMRTNLTPRKKFGSLNKVVSIPKEARMMSQNQKQAVKNNAGLLKQKDSGVIINKKRQKNLNLRQSNLEELMSESTNDSLLTLPRKRRRNRIFRDYFLYEPEKVLNDNQ